MPEMKLKRAVKIAEDCMKAEMQKFAFEANVYRLHKTPYPVYENAYKRREEIKQAIQLLKSLML